LLIGLEKKLQSVFQDDSQKIFDFSEEKLKQFREKDFKPKCEAALKNIEDNEEKIELFLDNVDQPDFIRFLRAIVKL
jgi:NAD-dependent SIR2 family protein deacetylase